jgi:nitrite reductase/ring-hydroxylating ferredoxin subunit
MTDTGLTEGELWVGEMRGLVVAGCPLLLVRHEQGISAFEDRCPHQGFPLSAGELAGGVITCPVHRHQFDATSGAGVNPLRPCLVRLEVRVHGGQIAVQAEAGKAAP